MDVEAQDVSIIVAKIQANRIKMNLKDHSTDSCITDLFFFFNIFSK